MGTKIEPTSSDHPGGDGAGAWQTAVAGAGRERQTDRQQRAWGMPGRERNNETDSPCCGRGLESDGVGPRFRSVDPTCGFHELPAKPRTSAWGLRAAGGAAPLRGSVWQGATLAPSQGFPILSGSTAAIRPSPTGGFTSMLLSFALIVWGLDILGCREPINCPSRRNSFVVWIKFSPESVRGLLVANAQKPHVSARRFMASCTQW